MHNEVKAGRSRIPALLDGLSNRLKLIWIWSLKPLMSAKMTGIGPFACAIHPDGKIASRLARISSSVGRDEDHHSPCCA
jgi:hypothetical protein